VNKPNFFIVGAPKCGTTAMNDYLMQHPDVFMAPKELHFFGTDLKLKNKIKEHDYLSYFQNSGNKKVIGEASVWYLFSKNAAREIKNFSPDARILIMLRNPVEVIHSLHSQHLYDGNEDVTDFEKALNLDDARKKGMELADSIDFSETPAYRDSVLFSEQVKRYMEVFNKKNVHIILFEDFKNCTKKIMLETLQFLEVNPDIHIEYDVVNPNRQIRSFYLHRLIKKPSRIYKKITRTIIPFKKMRHILMKTLFKSNIKISQRKKLSPQLDAKLKASFSTDILALSKIINRDLSSWL